MIIIGEKLNSTLSNVHSAIENHDAAFIQDLALRQSDAGAVYIDINAGMFLSDEPEKLEWMVESVQDAIKTPLSLDSPNPRAIERALKANKNSKPLINSITCENERFNTLLPLISEYNTSVIALCLDDNGMPETVEDRLMISDRLINRLVKAGISIDDIFIDPMIRPISTGSNYGIIALDTIRKVRESFPNVHITSGLSNVSFGLPVRKLLNQAFLVSAIYAGMDAAIMNPLDKRLMSLLYASETLVGKDDYCMEFLTKFREGYFES